MEPRPSPRAELVLEALRAHDAELRRFVVSRVGRADADDVLQLAALRALDRAEGLDDPARVRSWLFTIHRHLATDTLRQRARRERLHQAVADEEAPAEAPSLEPNDICRCSAVQAMQLRPSYRAVLQLVDLGGASVSEAAEALGLSVNNTRVRLHRARGALRRALMAHCGVASFRECLDCRCVPDGCCA